MTEGEGATEGLFTLVECDDGGGELEAHFFRAFQALLPTLEDAASEDAIGAAVDAMVELFRAVAAPPLTSVRGLWAELFLIAEAGDPERVLAAWHAIPTDRFDFATDDQRIEVKATARTRHARFVLEQLQPLGLRVVVYSTVVESTSAGSTIGDLIREISGRMNDAQLAQRLVVGVAQALGSDFAAWDSVRFDDAIARDQARFFAADAVPRVAEPPAYVTDVRFTVDLAGVPPIAPDELHSARGLLGAAAPAS